MNVARADAQPGWSLPAPWSAQDIGAVAIPGESSFDQGTFTINASGADIWGQSDQFHFVYQQISGDVELTARIDSVSMTDRWAKSGVMIRASLAPSAAHAFALVSAGSGVGFQRRTQNGALSAHTPGPSVPAPYWVRLVRAGTRITAYSSADGTTWSTIARSTVALGTTAYVGIATTSHNNGAATTAVASQVKVLPLALPPSQQAIDIGAPAIKGSVSFRDGVYTHHAGGADIWGSADQFNFLYQAITGDVEVVARVRSISSSSSRAKSGVMIREDLTPGSRHAFALATPGRGLAFERRIDTDGFSLRTPGPGTAPPGWVRLVRTGSRIEAFTSSDGAAWMSIGSEAIPMTDAVYVGIATTSRNASAGTDAVLDNLKITPAAGSPSNQPPQVTITGPADGTTFALGTDIPLTAAASDTDGTIAGVRFFAGSTAVGSASSDPYSVTWSPSAAGTYSLTAVATDNAGATTSSTPVSVKIDPAPNTPPTVTLTAPADGSTYTAPATIVLSATASDPENALARVEFYSGATLLGSATTAPYSFTWSSVAAGTYGVRAVAYDAAGASAASATNSITVNAPNAPPTVTLTAPANRAAYTAPATVVLSATASDPENALARVEFYSGATLLGSATTAPYSFTWSSVAAGTYSVRAVAFDTAGASAASATNSITVNAPNAPPTVTLTAPANGAAYTAPATVVLSATASDPENALARVEFYSGAALLGTATAAPYSFTWASIPAGTYNLRAVAYDTAGASASSSTITITVNTPVTPPPTGVAFQASVDHASVTSYELRIYASNANPATATPIASSDLAKPAPDANGDITVDRTAFFSNLSPGSYVAAVAAIGTGGASVSTGVAFTR